MSQIESISGESDLALLETRLISASFKFLSPVVVGGIALRNWIFEPTVKVSKSAGEIQVFLNLSLIAHEQQNDLFELSAMYYGSFKVRGEVTTANLQTFASLSAPAIVFPLLRAAVATLTLSAGFPPLTLPVMNFQKVAVKVEESP